MIRERVAEDVYVFTSQLYAQVNAGAIVGQDWSILIDTLAYPEETREIRDFLEERLAKPVRYIINTHYHSDHTLGNCWFPLTITPTTPWAIAGFPTQQSSVTHSAALYLILKVNKLWQQQSEAIENSGI